MRFSVRTTSGNPPTLPEGFILLPAAEMDEYRLPQLEVEGLSSLLAIVDHGWSVVISKMTNESPYEIEIYDDWRE